MSGRNCSTCNIFKDWNEFSNTKQRGVPTKTARCLACYRICNQRYYNANKEQESKRSKAKYRKYIDHRRQYNSENKEYSNAFKRARKMRVKEATPPWADLTAIHQFYQNCPPGYHVDHIIPIKGKNISGLHVLENLQYLPASANISKNNKVLENTLTTYPTCNIGKNI